MISIPKKAQIFIALIVFFISNAQLSADINKPFQIVQILSNDDDIIDVKSGDTIEVYATYNVSDGQKVTGIGIQIHYNSNCLDLLNIDNVYPDGEQGHKQKNDSENEDNDPLTDRAIVLAWSSLGGNTWPYQELPIELIRMTLKVKYVGLLVSTQINVVEISKPGNYAFQGENLQLFINTKEKLDINDDGIFNMIDIIQTLNHVKDN